MNFKSIYQYFIYSLLIFLTACSTSDNEEALVDLFATASLDLIEISFPADQNEAVISADSFSDYSIEGLKTNGVDTVAVTSNIVWSLSEGAQSSIDQTGRLTAGSVAEALTITAKVGILFATFDVRISTAKFDQVIALNSTPVLVDLCQSQVITPIGNYINDDGSPDEERPVDSSVIDTIEWLIRNAGEDPPSQRALIKTENSQAELQALEIGDVIIQARAPSISQGGVIVTSADFDQSIVSQPVALKICLSSETDLDACTLERQDLVENNTLSLIAVGEYQQTDGSNSSLNISELSKWGTDNNSNVNIVFSDDRQQLDITGNLINTTTNLSVACGNVEQTIQDSDLVSGVVLDTPVTCAIGNSNCLQATQAITVVEEVVDSLAVTANGFDLVNNTALVFSSRPATLVFVVTATFTDGSSRVVTTDSTYTDDSPDANVVSEVSGETGEYTVGSTGNNVEISISFGIKTFTARLTLPN